MAENMPKKQHLIEYIAITGLVLVALVIGISRFKKGDADDEVFSRKEFTQRWKEVEILELEASKQEKEVSYTLAGESIPFKGPFDEMEKAEIDEGKVVLPTMKFQGMIWKSYRPQAIINNKVYDVNDIIEFGTDGAGIEVKITEINEDGIHLKYKGKEFIVRPK